MCYYKHMEIKNLSPKIQQKIKEISPENAKITLEGKRVVVSYNQELRSRKLFGRVYTVVVNNEVTPVNVIYVADVNNY